MTISTEIFPSTSLDSIKSDPAVYENLEKILINKNGQVPLHKRFRVIFTLKNLADEKSIDILAKDPMVRHEAGEALGAIGDPSSLDILEEYLNDEHAVVRETCELSIAKIKYEIDNDNNKQDIPKSSYTSIDPAPPNVKTQSVTELREILLETKLPLFERYRAMFALRNLGSKEAVLALAEGFNDPSALFRHEIAYVFGQMQSPDSVPALIKTLENMNELSMVRHEAAEALGSIATSDCLPALKKFKDDHERVVKESCEVALDMYEYENSKDFQYADGLSKA
ncbi:21152_t:CDS:2 [Rhizophagus irregularis]|nr:21152_t:CDS:2 [Rhizophagus irregularis]